MLAVHRDKLGFSVRNGGFHQRTAGDKRFLVCQCYPFARPCGGKRGQ